MSSPRLMILGLDCAPPSLVFDRWAEALPHLTALRKRGRWGNLESCAPPITVPAWAVMTSGQTPGELGLYGFRNRPRDRGYGLNIATSKDVKAKRIWDVLGEAGHKVASLFVPLTNPPRPVRGVMASCFLTPPGAPWTFPKSRAADWEQRFGPYHADVENFRSGDLERIFGELEAMADQHFALAKHVWVTDAPAMMMMVEMGPDRLHHACWHHLDPQHPAYVEGNAWEAKAKAYYQGLDARLGELFAIAEEDNAHVLVVSDHGARANLGGVAINEWLQRKGWQHWSSEPHKGAPVREHIDWKQSRAWGEGGYYARVFLNLEGREPEGAISSGRFEAERSALIEALKADFPGVRIDVPEEAYPAVQGQAPDLLVYFDDLKRRSIGTIGHGEVDIAEDVGTFAGDGCNHDWQGIYLLAGPTVQPHEEPQQASIYDVAPTVLKLFGLERPLRGRDLRNR